ncbi:unnamed protein product [Pleuronectes platessa]|uniref:Uncharacterized protein n=1 Tax=Pleuronectes platessa TaxID=8262 RepID=A0A9N7ULV4_PLEPL|nr:unnamed protein product [Pleuronectes platessa]
MTICLTTSIRPSGTSETQAGLRSGLCELLCSFALVGINAEPCPRHTRADQSLELGVSLMECTGQCARDITASLGRTDTRPQMSAFFSSPGFNGIASLSPCPSLLQC